jgi:hypothetical protein
MWLDNRDLHRVRCIANIQYLNEFGAVKDPPTVAPARRAEQRRPVQTVA